ncbi:MAG: L-ribulose-5-phosphate 4-epimerase AraD [Aliifodinibius sp.]|nr:L-ribulose-5-phosphate 4-epimerase AraD [Fodinibius sp.]NIV16135.1 L-ribulose-5-phosphate 4-epimerase AraD [Fodinibius sp.]NIY30114.1 L-ribulose-5-phosphate 4-epimerase AraD [Fodinibius sp.]
MGSLAELKEGVWRCNMELFNKNLVIQTFGNVSGIDREKDIIAIKPSGIPYPELTSDKIVLVDLKNRIIDTKYKPSSDTKTHIVLYKAFPNIGGVVHTHSPYATAWAQAKRSIPCLGTTHADHVQGEIPCTEELTDEQIMGDYETETGNQIVKRFSSISPDEVEMVLVAGHGPFTWGNTPEKAVYNTVMLEEIARISFLTFAINPGVESLKRSLIDKHYLRKHGKDSYYGQK